MPNYYSQRDSIFGELKVIFHYKVSGLNRPSQPVIGFQLNDKSLPFFKPKLKRRVKYNDGHER